MDFSVLSRYDDMLANYFVDSLYLWFNTLRMNSDFVGATVDEQKVINVFRENLFSPRPGEGLRQATEVFLDFPYFRDFVHDLPLKQATEFSQHMKRYLAMYLPNAGFEVSSTKRYTGQMEACIVATRDWKAGEQVKNCLGSIAELTEEDDAKLKREGRDFSVMVSTRKKCSCLFLGPARFMNHDCDANCSFILIGQNAITFRVERDIQCGEEMTVFYAEHYFGEYNCECRCCSCERLQQGSFSVQQSEDEGESSLDENGNARRSVRKRKQVNYKDYFISTEGKRSRQSEALKETTNLEISAEPSSELTSGHKQIILETDKTKLFDTKWSRQESEKMSRVYNWMDEQSDLSDDDLGALASRKGRMNTTTTTTTTMTQTMTSSETITTTTMVMTTTAKQTRCCDYIDEFGIVEDLEGIPRCARCYRHYKIYNHEWPLRRPRRIYGRQKQKPISISPNLSTPPSPVSPPLSPKPVPKSLPKSLPQPKHTHKKAEPISEFDRLKSLADQGPRIIRAWSVLDAAPACIEASAPTMHQMEETLLADDYKNNKLEYKTRSIHSKKQTKLKQLHQLTERQIMLQQLLEKYKKLLDYQQNTNSQAEFIETTD